MPLHFGQESAGGETFDSTLNSSDMESLLFRVKDQLFRYKIPGNIKGEPEFL